MTSKGDDKTEEERRKNEDQSSSSSSYLIGDMSKQAASQKSAIMKELESLTIQSLEYETPAVPKELEDSGLYMTRRKTRTLQGIPEKPSPSLSDQRRIDQSTKSVSQRKRTQSPSADSLIDQDHTDKVNSARPKRSKTMDASEGYGTKSDPPNAIALKAALIEKRAEGLDKWNAWQERKGTQISMTFVSCVLYALLLII
jgi:hypothetical protein